MTDTTSQLTSPGKLEGRYTIDPVHSSFGFAVRYMGVSTFRNTFTEVDGELDAQGGEPRLEGRAKVESIGITTPEQFRAHVLSGEFFDAETHPYIEFRSTRIELNDDATATVEGELTIKGHTETVSAHGTWQGDTPHAFGGERAALQLEATVDRTKFGISWNNPLPSGEPALSNEVTLIADLQFVKQA
jgi:polyisoprenoid-binding protein YceI